MKSKFLLIGALSMFTLTAFSAQAVVVNGGKVHFEGEIVNGTCAVDAGSVNQIVQLGQVKANSLNTLGATSTAVGFNIQLNDCEPGTITTAAIAFSGVTATSEGENGNVSLHPNVLALQNSAAGSATNVGIQILDSTGAALNLDGASFSVPKTLIEGTNILPFQARYYATGTSTAGIANADATFQVEYL